MNQNNTTTSTAKPTTNTNGIHANLRAYPDAFASSSRNNNNNNNNRNHDRNSSTDAPLPNRSIETNDHNILRSANRTNRRIRSNSVFETPTFGIGMTSSQRQQQQTANAIANANANTNTTTMMMPKSYDGKGFLFRHAQPSHQLYRQQSATIPGMSSITYSGYLYKRSNHPVAEEFLEHGEQQYEIDPHGNAHRPVHEVDTMYALDPVGRVPKLPVMPAMFAGTGMNEHGSLPRQQTIETQTQTRTQTQIQIQIQTQLQSMPPSAQYDNSTHLRNNSITELAESLQPIMQQQYETPSRRPHAHRKKGGATKNALHIALEFFGVHLDKNNDQHDEEDSSGEIRFDQSGGSGAGGTNEPNDKPPPTSHPSRANAFATPRDVAATPSTTTAPIKFVSGTGSIAGSARSARRPIPILASNHNKSSSALPPSSSFHEALHRRNSEPIPLSQSPRASDFRSVAGHTANEIPRDFVDPEDRHLWRAKYCVLEDGILYFYRNATDGNSMEASAERKRNTRSRMEETMMEQEQQQQHHHYQQQQQQQQRTNNNSTSYDGRSSLLSGKLRFGGGTGAGLVPPWNPPGGEAGAGRPKNWKQDLSKSPMVRPDRHLLHHIDSSGIPLPDAYADAYADTDTDTIRVMWEKRVFMDCVGGVRTAEQQYGQNAFELLAMEDSNKNNDNDDDGDDDEYDDDCSGSGENKFIDRLVLKGQDPTEMKEWIFQFHRTLASFMRNFIDNQLPGSIGSGGGGVGLEHRHPSSSMLSTSLSSRQLSASLSSANMVGLSQSIPHSSSEKHLHRLISTSPSVVQQTLLSHGHGRTTLKRRMDVKRTASETASLSSTPDAGDLDFSNIPFVFREHSPSNVRASPESISPPVRHLIPPAVPVKGRLHEMAPTAAATPAVMTPLASKLTPGSDDSTRRDADLPPSQSSSSSSPMKSKPLQFTVKASTTASGSKGKYIPPHLRRKTKYVPPHLRRQQNQQSQDGNGSCESTKNKNDASFFTSAEPYQYTPITPPTEHYSSTPTSAGKGTPDQPDTVRNSRADQLDIVDKSTSGFVLGGCADPQLIEGSILDEMFIPKRASRLEKTNAEAHGSFGGAHSDDTKTSKSALRWEIGAISECGVRESNEDSYILTNDLLNAFDSTSYGTPSQNTWREDDTDHSVGLFGIFDGHCGNQGARYAVEQLGRFIHSELRVGSNAAANETPFSSSQMESVLHEAIVKMDDEFCSLCQEGGREWESGATALVAMLANENLVIASLGDCRGFLCRSVDDAESYSSDDGWEQLEIGPNDFGSFSAGKDNSDSNGEAPKHCFWREVTTVHSPSAEKEKTRIEKANGWITTETEIPIGQFRRMDFHDEDVIGILKRCMHLSSSNGETNFTDSERSTKKCNAAPQRIIHISRVCGELAVSRAIGDRDFKADFNSSSKHDSSPSDDASSWETTLFLPYPENHNRCFRGDLVTNTPDFHRMRVGQEGVSMEFLLLACDGLWDVMDADDAVRIVRDLLYRKKVTAKKAAARLAELAVHLGSSDNITVVLVRLFSRDDIE